MDVTCERCHTEYEFDDALVSEQGTSVRCTQCGHKFRVKKEGGAPAPEIWVVRTVDGRELEFRAIRELKSSISAGRISRNDVLSRGVGRPRRLASIAELEPFFSGQIQQKTNTSIGLGDEPRPRSRTPQGLGPPQMLIEDSQAGRDNSVAIPLPSASQSEVTRQYPRELAEDLGRLEDDTQKAGNTTATFGTPAVATSREASSLRATPALGTPLPARTPLPSTTKATTRGSAAELAPSTEREPSSVEPETSRRPLAETPVGARVTTVSTPKSGIDAYAATQPIKGLEPGTPAPSPISSSSPSNGAGAGDKPPQSVGDRTEAPKSQREAVMLPLSEVEPATLSRDRTGEPPPVRAVDPRPVSDPQLGSNGVAPAAIARTDTVADARGGRESMDSIPPEPGMRRGSQTPTPSDVRYSLTNEDSNISSDPRLSASSTSSRGASGATRLIVGVLVAGALAFALVLLVQRFVLKPSAKTDAASDQRVAAFLAEGERNLIEGDLDAAKEQLDKASALGDSDPRVARALARLANARAETPWLKLRLLTTDDPDRDATKREYTDATERARKAVDRALALAPTDAEVIRTEVDQKRLSGDVSGARKLVDGMSSVAAQPESGLVLGALDLAEESPPWPSIIERLSKAASDEGTLGRARALLIYSLAMSGDPKRARAELGRLTALQRPHPLTGALRKLLDRIDKGETPPLKVDDLPSLSTPGDAGVLGEGVPGSTSLALRQALEARTKGDSRRAENLYQSVIDKDPNNSEALSGLASLARSQGANGRAMGLFQRVVDHNPNYVPAIMSLADMKWDSGDRGAASALYARALELGANDPRAKERSGGGATPPPVDSTTSSATGTGPTPEPGGSTGGGAPTPPPTPPIPDEAPKEDLP